MTHTVATGHTVVCIRQANPSTVHQPLRSKHLRFGALLSRGRRSVLTLEACRLATERSQSDEEHREEETADEVASVGNEIGDQVNCSQLQSIEVMITRFRLVS